MRTAAALAACGALLLSLLFAQLCRAATSQPGAASALFESHKAALFQVKVIDAPSGDRQGLGTGFAIDRNLVATNFHVIAQFLERKDGAPVRLLDVGKREFPADIIAVDVINDLALLRSREELPQVLQLASEPPPMGATIFALGNPFDLGMAVTQGIYNGIKTEAFPPRVHYAGPVNAGMSGGPTIDEDGEVIGVNVATARNSVGFLVPVAALRDLRSRAADEVLDRPAMLAAIRTQLADTQQNLMDRLLAAPWPQQSLGSARVPERGADFISCWGRSEEDDGSGVDAIQRGCNSESQLLIRRGFSTMFIEYEFAHLRSDGLSPFRFYQQAGQYYGKSWPGNRARKDDVSNYHCVEDQLALQPGLPGAIRFKTLYCTRAYRDLTGLFDAFYVAMSTDREDEILFTHFTLSGFSRDNIERFLKRFLETIAWQ